MGRLASALKIAGRAVRVQGGQQAGAVAPRKVNSSPQGNVAPILGCPVTRHLALSRALLFLFDPTQDVRFRRACRGRTDDPQMIERTERLARERPVRQETIFIEAAERIRRYAGLGHNLKYSRPLVIVVTKFDSWAPLLKVEGLPRTRTVGDGRVVPNVNGGTKGGLSPFFRRQQARSRRNLALG